MGKIILTLGGCRSGKTSFAESLANRHESKTYLATCHPQDEEMQERVRRHQEQRGTGWNLVEETVELEKVFTSCRDEVILMDCITLWVTNLLLKGEDPLVKTDSLIESIGQFLGTAILVSNEVGYGIVPENSLARRFRDVAGLVNQKLAAAAHEVILVTAGIPQVLKK